MIRINIAHMYLITMIIMSCETAAYYVIGEKKIPMVW